VGHPIVLWAMAGLVPVRCSEVWNTAKLKGACRRHRAGSELNGLALGRKSPAWIAAVGNDGTNGTKPYATKM
jgi:hypothetical protein